MDFPLKSRDSLLATVIYSDIFSYPLTEKEIVFWLIKRKQINRDQLADKFLVSQMIKGKKYYALKNHQLLFALRQRRTKHSQLKWKLAERIAKYLRLISTIKLVGVSGALALDNADKNDDIDFFILTQRNCLWSTRLWVIILSEILGIRRRPKDKQVNNKACFNLFLSEDKLELPQSEHDLFAAHELLQLKILWSKGDSYRQLLLANSWVKDFLPNAWKKKTAITQRNQATYFLPHFLESLAKWLQLWYMKKHQTTELITDAYLRFHPRDARFWVKQEFSRKLKQYKIPLDKLWQ